MATRKEIKTGVIGCGWWSTTAHLPALRDDPRARLVAIADPDERNRTRASAAFEPDSVYADWRGMLDAVELDAVVVATPNGLHFEPAKAVLASGANVLIEKPMVVDRAEAAELVCLAERTRSQIVVGYTWNYTPHAIALRSAIAENGIGSVEHVSSIFASTARELYRGRPELLRDALGYGMTGPGTQTYSAAGAGGQAHSQLTHSVALALYLTELDPLTVSAQVASFELDVDLADSLVVRFANGALGSLDSVGSVQPGQHEIHQCRVFGDSGHVQLDLIRGTASIHGPGAEVETLDQLAEAERYPEQAPARNLVGVTLGDEPNRAPGELGRRVVDLLCAARESASRETSVSLRERSDTAVGSVPERL